MSIKLLLPVYPEPGRRTLLYCNKFISKKMWANILKIALPLLINLAVEQEFLKKFQHLNRYKSKPFKRLSFYFFANVSFCFQNS